MKKPADLDLHCFQLSLYLVSDSFKKKSTFGISTETAKLFVHYLPFGTSKLFFGHVHYGHLLVPGQV